MKIHQQLGLPVAESYKKDTKRYISPICPEAPNEWICTKFSLGGPLVDILNSAEFCCSRLMGFDSVRGQNLPSRIDLAGRR